MKRVLVLFVALSLVLVSLVGCNTQKGESNNIDPVTVKDSSGTEVTISKKPERIISLVPSSTEIVYALGLGEKIVGVTTYDDFPEEVKTKEKVGDLTVNTEKVVSLQPDLVLANSLNGEAVDSLRKLGMTVLVLNASTFNEVYTTIEMIGKATGTSKQSAELVATMKKDVEDVKKVVKGVPQEKKPKVWVEINDELFTTGKGTFMHDIIEMAGGINIAADLEGWKQLSEEQIIVRNPEVIFNTYSYMNPNAAKMIKERAKWQQLNAVKNGKVFDVDSSVISRPGPRITQGLKEVAKLLHPELFQ